MFDDVITTINKPGAVAVIPTDTVYGIVARAADEPAVARLYNLKHREQKPGTIIAASIEQLTDLGLKRRYMTAVEAYWPGAVSVIIPAADPKLAYLHQGKQSLAVRIPDHKALRAMLKKTGPLLTSSANHPGEPTAATFAEAKNYFNNDVDAYVDGGDLHDHQPSTVIRVVDDAIEILREGAVQIESNN